MKTGNNLTHEWAHHYGIAPKRGNESQEDFEKRVATTLDKEAGVSINKPGEVAHGKWALMAIFL